jgi:hypothetical protein
MASTISGQIKAFSARRLGPCALVIALLATPASAHPHVWVAVETTVQAERGAFTGLRQRWTFDEFYSAMAIEGLDANGDGVLDRQELAELAKVNMDGLKEFAYFTFAELSGQKLAFTEPADVSLEHKTVEEAPGAAMEPLPGAAGADGVNAPPANADSSDKAKSGNFFGRAWDSL